MDTRLLVIGFGILLLIAPVQAAARWTDCGRANDTLLDAAGILIETAIGGTMQEADTASPCMSDGEVAGDLGGVAWHPNPSPADDDSTGLIFSAPPWPHQSMPAPLPATEPRPSQSMPPLRAYGWLLLMGLTIVTFRTVRSRTRLDKRIPDLLH